MWIYFIIGEKPNALSNSGKEIQGIIKRGQRDRTAHVPNFQPRLSNPNSKLVRKIFTAHGKLGNLKNAALTIFG